MVETDRGVFFLLLVLRIGWSEVKLVCSLLIQFSFLGHTFTVVSSQFTFVAISMSIPGF